MTDNPFQPPASAVAPATDPYAPLREALAAWPRQAVPLVLKLIALYLVVVISVVLCFVPALFVVPLAGWTAGRVLLGTADGDPPIPWGRMTLRRLWPTGAALTLLGGALATVSTLFGVATLLLPYPAALVASLMANVSAWPIYALVTFTFLRWADDDHEAIDTQRALTDAGRLIVGHAPTWGAIYAIPFAINLPGHVLTFERGHGMFAQVIAGVQPSSTAQQPIDFVFSLVALSATVWSSLALARLYRVAHPAQPPAASTPTAAHP